MKVKRLAGLALLLSVVMLGAFISGCIDQGNSTDTYTSQTQPPAGADTETPTRTETPPETQTPTQTQTPPKGTPQEEELRELIASYEGEIDSAKAKLSATGFEATGGDFALWDAKAEELKAMAGKETDPERKSDMLRELAELRYYQLLNLRTLAGIGAVERAYWENATTGEPIESFYNMRGEFFYTEKGRTVKMDLAKMAEKMHSLLKGYRIESVEIYHFGTGSTMMAVWRGGELVKPGYVMAVKIGVPEGGMKLRLVGENNESVGTLVLKDMATGEELYRISPDKNGLYTIPAVGGDVLAETDPPGGGFCYRPLELNVDTTLEPIPEEEPEFTMCTDEATMMPLIFQPSPSGDATIGMAQVEESRMPDWSTMRGIREGGRTVGAGQVAITINAKDGMKIKAGNGTDFGTLRLVDPETGEIVMNVAPNEEGIYTVPPVNTTLLGIIDDDFCYRPLPHDNNYLELMDVQDEPLDLDEAICSLNAQIAPFVFEPTDSDTGPFDPAPMEELYLMPGQYTVQTLVMKADLKQLAEQVVNINMRRGIEKNDIRRGMVAVADIRPEWTDGGGSSIQTPAETTCSCTFSPLLNGIFRETFGGEPFGEVPAVKDINITDFGNGPFIPELWKGFENYSAVIRIYGITNSDGETLILIGDPGANRLAPSYLDRVFLEIYTGRNPQTGKEIKIAAFKILNTDGTIGIRTTTLMGTSKARLFVLPSGGELSGTG